MMVEASKSWVIVGRYGSKGRQLIKQTHLFSIRIELVTVPTLSSHHLVSINANELVS